MSVRQHVFDLIGRQIRRPYLRCRLVELIGQTGIPHHHVVGEDRSARGNDEPAAEIAEAVRMFFDGHLASVSDRHGSRLWLTHEIRLSAPMGIEEQDDRNWLDCADLDPIADANVHRCILT